MNQGSSQQTSNYDRDNVQISQISLISAEFFLLTGIAGLGIVWPDSLRYDRVDF